MEKFFIASLAVWRLSALIAYDDGPYSALHLARAKVAQRGADSKFWNMISEGIHCVWCSSIWFGALFAVWTASDLVSWFVHLSAMSGVAILANSYVMGRREEDKKVAIKEDTNG